MDNVLRRGIHQIEFALMLHNVCDAWILPYTHNTFAHVWVERRMWIWIHHIVQ